MKQFVISKRRWENLVQGLLELGKGKLDQQLLIRNLNDDFETIEALFNLVSEELRERLIHLSFTKPNEFQKYTNHFIIIVNRNFIIKNVCDSFLSHFSMDFSSLKKQSLLGYVDPDTADFLKSPSDVLQITNNQAMQSIVLLKQSFLFNIKSFNNNKTQLINLYQLQIDNKYFNPAYLKDTIEKGRLIQKRRNEDIIEQVKFNLDNRSLSQKISLKQLCIDFGINSNQLKKLFKEQYQCSVYEYHISLRMKHAHLLIETSTLPFKEISEMVGYSQYSAFVNYFKMYYKILPNQLRKISQTIQKS
ncbi:helix-turn-helix domain-containing protein [Flavobacterium sp. JP2137]|uniref:helix-turn-helix domain-containing protein n=1 Tax=Flavobacterium sp. JP2137 TaxID=3414510 RepID=UPI003D2FBC04